MPSAATTEAPIVPAASLIPARAGNGRLEICLLQRSRSSRFMPGSFVFPGGWIDASDRDAAFWGPRCDLSADVVRRLARGADPATAVSAALAAVRETFEEAGVLFASPADAAAAAAPTVERSAFRHAFDGQRLTLTLTPLSPWSHWITPVGMPRRFDTRFFVAAAPEGQSVRPDGRETTAAVWLPPRAALQANLSGRLPLSPPTLVTLHQLLAYATLDQLCADAGERPWGEPILPRLVPLGEGYGAVIVEPWDPMYTRPDIPVDAAALDSAVLPVGEPFSRIWYRDGFCRPVRV